MHLDCSSRILPHGNVLETCYLDNSLKSSIHMFGNHSSNEIIAPVTDKATHQKSRVWGRARERIKYLNATLQKGCYEIQEVARSSYFVCFPPLAAACLQACQHVNVRPNVFQNRCLGIKHTCSTHRSKEMKRPNLLADPHHLLPPQHLPLHPKIPPRFPSSTQRLTEI